MKPYTSPSSKKALPGEALQSARSVPRFFLRSHQQRLWEIVQEIKSGAPINRIYCDVTPGGGKSLLPVLLCELRPEFAQGICWVVPRKSLQYQGEREFIDAGSQHRVRIANNTPDPGRGYAGYITTYQGIAADPKLHKREFEHRQYILFLDEPHHIKDGALWFWAIEPLVRLARLVVFASGTLFRGDGERIGFIDYSGNKLDLKDSDTARVIRYTRTNAIREGAICPVYFRQFDGQAKWKKDDEEKEVFSLSDDPAALFTALRTEYARDLLMCCYEDWREHKKIFCKAKMLIVAPDIRLACQYMRFLEAFTKAEILIATSDDSAKAQENIARFKNLKKYDSEVDILVTVAMAYEGLSVRQITHIACLTHIRSIPWLEQCFARANRLYPGKGFGVIYLPADSRMSTAIRMIEAEQRQGLKEKTESEESGLQDEDSQGGERKTIQPLSSQAYFIPEIPSSNTDPVARMTPSEIEKTLKEQIRGRIKAYIDSQRPGSQSSCKRIIYMKIRKQVPKSIDHMNQAELEKILELAIKECPL